MHKLKILALLLVSAVSIVIYSCSKSDKADVSASTAASSRTEHPVNFKTFNIPFPEGTAFNITSTGVDFDLPEPYYVLGLGIDGNYYRSIAGGGGSVTCKCTKGSGCDPIKSGGDYGCLMKEGCSSCDKSTAAITGVQVDISQFIIINPEFNIAVDEFSQLDNQHLLSSKFLDASEFVELLAGLNENMSESTSPEKKVAFLNAYGYILPLEVPIDMDNTSLSFKSINGNAAGATCTCNIAGKSCPRDSKFGVVWCNSDNCTSCTMSGIVVNNTGDEMTFTEADGLIHLQ